jgi:hypothetical protein
MPLTLVALKSELQNDPRGYEYNAVARNDSDMLTKINAKRDGTNAPSNPTAGGGSADGSIKINNVSVDTGTIRAAITKAAYDGLTTGDRSWLNWLSGSGSITVTTDLLQTLAGIPTSTGSVWAVSSRTAMNAAMDTLLRKFASRSEELFGQQVTLTDIGNALNS